ncbi:MAG: MFS transporter [Actinomycetales bacterium]|nr:MFS transporter [Actinomycetales bacterium]
MSSAPASDRLPMVPLLVLAGAVFASVTSEFLPTGVLPQIAAELGVSESRVGLLVTIFAATVVVTAVPLTALTSPIPRKTLMVVLLGGFALSNVAAALAPSYELLAVARVFGGLCHGLFWAVTGPYAARLVTRRHLARAVSIANGGGTLAFILGVPIGAALGAALGWRWAFGVMSGVVLVFLVLVVLLLPAVEHRVTLATAELSLPTRKDRTIPGILVIAVTIFVVATGHNALYTYIAPWVSQVGGVPLDGVSGELFAFGLAGAVGLVAAGVFGDRFPRAALPVAIGVVILAVVLLALLGPGSPIATTLLLVLWSAGFGGIPALVHARMLHTASLRVRDLGSAIITIAFNAAISLGALLGGLVLDHAGIAWIPWTLVAIVTLGLGVALATEPIRARAAGSPPAPAGAGGGQPDR